MSSGGGAPAIRFQHQDESESALDVLSRDGFAENVVRRRDPLDRWTLYHSARAGGAMAVPARLYLAVQALAKTNPAGAGDRQAASPTARCFRRGRRSSATRGRAGTGRRRRTIAQSSSPSMSEPSEADIPCMQHDQHHFRMAGDAGVIFPVTGIDVRVSDEPHPYCLSHQSGRSLPTGSRRSLPIPLCSTAGCF
jgi:hypothetical protein